MGTRRHTSPRTSLSQAEQVGRGRAVLPRAYSTCPQVSRKQRSLGSLFAGFIASWVVIKLVKQHPDCKVRVARGCWPDALCQAGYTCNLLPQWRAGLRRTRIHAPPSWLPNASANRHPPPPSSTLPGLRLQVVVLDKLDYCATLNNLSAVRSAPNFK